MAWSDAARRAAAEARRRKKIPHGASRSFYASELRAARQHTVSKGQEVGKKRNKWVRRQAKWIVGMS